MPIIAIDVTEDQYSRYVSALQKLNNIAGQPAKDQLAAPLLPIIGKLVLEAEVNQGTVSRNAWMFFPTPPASPEEEADTRFREVQLAVQRRLDEFFRTREYDGVLSACTYATSTNPKFAAEGQYAVETRDAHWNKCYEILGAVQAGTRPLPTVDEVLAEMPPLTWPV